MPTKPKVLIIDDDPIFIQVLCSVLEDEYELTIALKALDGLNLISSDKFNVIVIDINMPECDGFQLFKKMQEQESVEDIPVIFLSGLQDKLVCRRVFDAGGVEFIQKPIEAEHLKTRIDTYSKLSQRFYYLKTPQV